MIGAIKAEWQWHLPVCRHTTFSVSSSGHEIHIFRDKRMNLIDDLKFGKLRRICMKSNEYMVVKMSIETRAMIAVVVAAAADAEAAAHICVCVCYAIRSDCKINGAGPI